MSMVEVVDGVRMGNMNDYPEEDELELIRTWPYQDPFGWFNYIKQVGNYWPEDLGWRESQIDDRGAKEIYIATGGWSGNEEIIAAMRKNILWSVTWEFIRRGGGYTFRVRKAE